MFHFDIFVYNAFFTSNRMCLVTYSVPCYFDGMIFSDFPCLSDNKGVVQ